MSLLIRRGNDALNVNSSAADRRLTTHGSNWLWACTAIYAFTFLAWLLWTIQLRRQRSTTTTATAPSAIAPGDQRRTVSKSKNHAAATDADVRGERIFHYLFTVAAFTGLIAYFTMASNLGNTPVRQFMNQGSSSGTGAFTREVFYARYIYWFVAWPLVLIASLLLSGLSWASIFFAVTLLEIWIVSWLSGALVSTRYRWGYYVFGAFSYIVLAYILLAWGRASSRLTLLSKSYTMLAGLLAAVWMLYLIAWPLSEGSNRLSVTGEMVFYGILDLISVPAYGTLFLIKSRSFDHASYFEFSQHGRMAGRGMHRNTDIPPVGHNDVPISTQSGV